MDIAHTETRVPARVSVVGDGRLGSALAGALRVAGIDVLGPARRNERPGAADALVLCVPDAEIERAAASAAGCAPLVGHTSGATPLSALAAAGGDAFGLHPLQTFTGGEPAARFHGAGCAVAGATPAALGCAHALAGALGMHAVEIADGARPAYHAAASIASNFLVTLLSAAEDAAQAAGLERREARSLLTPLVESTVANWASLGPERALTGPVARGDRATVAAQRDALAHAAAHLLPLFDELAERTRVLADGRVAA